jgi:thiol-disulfide isomerase/thioredoxin
MTLHFRSALVSMLILIHITGYAQHRSIISGYLLGNDGQPMLVGHVTLSGIIAPNLLGADSFPEDLSITQVAPDGSFSISIDSTGPFYLIFTGVGHKMFQVPFILDHPMDCQIEVHLEILHLVDDFRYAEVLYNFDEETHGRGIRMKEIAPRVFLADLTTNQSQFQFRFMNIGGCPYGESVLGATADSFEYSFGRSYTSIVHSHEGRVRIILADTLPRPVPRHEGITFLDSLSVQSRFYKFHRHFEDMKADRDSALHRHMVAGGAYSSFVYDWTKTLNSIKSEYANEHESIIRHELLMEYIEVASLAPKRFDSSFVRQNIGSVPIGSLVWIYHGTTVLDAGTYHPQGEKYVKEILNKHPSRSFRAILMSQLFETAMMRHRQQESVRLFRILTTEYFNTPAGKITAMGPHPSTVLTIGMKFPKFAFTSVDDPMMKYTNADIKGKYTLLDFWATWCAPCVAQVKFIQNAYEKFHDENFQILSIALGDTPARVKYFRSAHWSMPWLNGIARENEVPAVSLAYDARTPRPILIAPDGKILAMDEPLSGEMLEKTLSKYLPRSR